MLNTVLETSTVMAEIQNSSRKKKGLVGEDSEFEH